MTRMGTAVAQVGGAPTGFGMGSVGEGGSVDSKVLISNGFRASASATFGCSASSNFS